MKKYEFTLARALELRRRQVEVEEARLIPILAERSALEVALVALEHEETQSRAELTGDPSQSGQDLSRYDAWHRFLIRRREQLRANLTGCLSRLDLQLQKVAGARRNVRLLERLDEQRRAEWETAAEKEIETLAAELFLARWNRR